MDFKQYASAKGTSYSGCSRDGPIAALGTHELQLNIVHFGAYQLGSFMNGHSKTGFEAV